MNTTTTTIVRFGEGDQQMDSINLANLLLLFSRSGEEKSQAPERVFECKTCSRQFPSFQALGGHRASHKKPRLSGDHSGSSNTSNANKPRAHECSICGVEFAIGQALGGHMRRHRAAVAEGNNHDSVSHGNNLAAVCTMKNVNGKRPAVCLDLDLNSPPRTTESSTDHQGDCDQFRSSSSTVIFGIELLDHKAALVH